MTVMVDQLVAWPVAAKAGARHVFGNGRQSCHLTADSLDELHAFALRIGLKRAWFQDHPSAPHYDLTPSRRAKALAAGAVFVSSRDQARARLRARAAL